MAELMKKGFNPADARAQLGKAKSSPAARPGSFATKVHDFQGLLTKIIIFIPGAATSAAKAAAPRVAASVRTPATTATSSGAATAKASPSKASEPTATAAAAAPSSSSSRPANEFASSSIASAVYDSAAVLYVDDAASQRGGDVAKASAAALDAAEGLDLSTFTKELGVLYGAVAASNKPALIDIARESVAHAQYVIFVCSVVSCFTLIDLVRTHTHKQERRAIRREGQCKRRRRRERREIRRCDRLVAHVDQIDSRRRRIGCSHCCCCCCCDDGQRRASGDSDAGSADIDRRHR